MTEAFFKLAEHAIQAIQKALGISEKGDVAALRKADESETEPLQKAPLELDPMLPGVCEALVLVTQCVVSLTLDDELERPGREGRSMEGEDLRSGWIDDDAEVGKPNERSSRELRMMINEVKRQKGDGVIEYLICGFLSLLYCRPFVHCHFNMQTSSACLNSSFLASSLAHLFPHFHRPVPNFRSLYQRRKTQPVSLTLNVTWYDYWESYAMRINRHRTG
jgi:hypothetical protein